MNHYPGWQREKMRRVVVPPQILSGPPGAGKTLIGKSLTGILPRMTVDESLEVTKVYSVADLLPSDTPLIRHRPFRSPHHTISYAELVGGGAWPRPGEISLAHRGVLFLDELPEFGERLLEVPRVEYDKLTSERRGELSEAVRARVEAAREIQLARFAGTDLFCIAVMGTSEVREFRQLDETGKQLMRSAMSQLGLSARAFHRA